MIGLPESLHRRGRPCLPYVALTIVTAAAADPPTVDVWYGDRQAVNAQGVATPTVHVLGRVSDPADAVSASYSVNGRGRTPLAIGPDLHRLANAGDFNAEVDRADLRVGENTVRIAFWTRRGVPVRKDVTLVVAEPKPWPLPYAVDFREVERLSDVVEVTDGLWELTEDGVRTAAPYYDRVLAFGDASWRDYELYAEVIVHRRFPPTDGRRTNGPPYLDHTHTSFNLRWAGFPDDGWRPRRDWMAVGSLVAMRSDLRTPNAGSYWWMHFGRGVPGVKAKRSVVTKETRLPFPEGVPHAYRMRVRTTGNRAARYSAKAWPLGEPEPAEWQMVAEDAAEAVPGGCAAFVVHHSDSTLRRVEVTPLGD